MHEWYAVSLQRWMQKLLRIISNMPKWEPGENNGVPVSVKYTIPIMFRLR